MDNFNEILEKLGQDYDSTLQKGTGDAYSRLSTIFEELGAYMREYIQDITLDEIKVVIGKLKGGGDLTLADKDQIKLWLVGDADTYSKMENNYQDWLDELGRLMNELRKFSDITPDVASCSKMRALFRDGSRVLADLFYFIEQKDRVEKFEKSSQNFTDTERGILVRLLEQKIQSPDF